MEKTAIIVSTKARVVFAGLALAMFALWAWSLQPVVVNWGNPYDDGFSVVGLFYATPICLPIGFILLAGAILDRPGSIRRARTAAFLAGGVLFIVVAFLIFQYVANSMDGV